MATVRQFCVKVDSAYIAARFFSLGPIISCTRVEELPLMRRMRWGFHLDTPEASFHAILHPVRETNS